MVICNCCFASLQKAKNVMANNPELAAEINEILAKDGLKFEGTTAIQKVLELFLLYLMTWSFHISTGVTPIKFSKHLGIHCMRVRPCQ